MQGLEIVNPMAAEKKVQEVQYNIKPENVLRLFYICFRPTTSTSPIQLPLGVPRQIELNPHTNLLLIVVLIIAVSTCIYT